jgi:mono/diheme cytochrome c family protein
MPVHSFSCGLRLLLLANVACAFGQEIGDPAAGRQLAEAKCRRCHGVMNNKAPAFSAVAAMPSTTARSLSVFLRTSHPTMPNLVLTNRETEDVIAYILSLR